MVITFPQSSPEVQVEYDNNLYVNGDVLTVTMNQFDTLQIQSANFGDLTGTHIESNKPISVFSGNIRTSVQGSSRDHLVEQLPPVNSWGKKFHMVPIPDRTTGDILRIVAAADNTFVTVYFTTGSDLEFSMMKGEFQQLDVGSDQYITIVSTLPILCVQIVKSQASSSSPELADPAMILLLSEEQYSSDYRFALPSGVASADYLNFFMIAMEEVDDIDGLQVDGVNITIAFPNVAFTPFANSSYIGTHIELSGVGSHEIQHVNPSVKFSLGVYGAGDRESYAFPTKMYLDGVSMHLYIFKPLLHLHFILESVCDISFWFTHAQ